MNEILPMKRILVVHYSQTGQLNAIVKSIVGPFTNNPEINVVFEEIRPQQPYAFPWGFTDFFNTFPETVNLDVIPIEPLSLARADYASFDLVILAYQVWFLSPSLPITAFLKSDAAREILKDKPVITVIGCRNMWLQAQEQVKVLLANVGARLIDNVVLIDAAGTALSFISTPLWMLTGKKGPVGFLPKAGVSEHNIAAASRFGDAIGKELLKTEPDLNHSLLQGLEAVKVNENLIMSEVMARRGFVIWGKLLRRIGGKENPVRRVLIYFYVVYLVTLILTFVPLSAIIKKILSPLLQKRIKEQKAFFSLPSGDGNYNMESNK
jgi:hypothetical protein